MWRAGGIRGKDLPLVAAEIIRGSATEFVDKHFLKLASRCRIITVSVQ